MATKRGRRSAPVSVLTFLAPVAGHPKGATVEDTRANRARFAKAIERGFLVDASAATAEALPAEAPAEAPTTTKASTATKEG